MSLVFTDIAGFSTIAETMEPAALTEHMATYFDAMIRIIESHGGTVDKLIGDAIVAFWGAPKLDDSHAANAVRATLDCLAQLGRLNAEWEASGLPPLPTRFGISTGAVVVGNVGSPGRLSYTALGDSVNLASRLEGANSFYGTSALVSSATQAEAGDGFCWRRVDLVAVKGRSKPELIFEPLGLEQELGEKELGWVRAYEDALDAYLGRRFDEAIEKLQPLTLARPGDRSAARLLSRCQAMSENPPPGDWDGVSRFREQIIVPASAPSWGSTGFLLSPTRWDVLRSGLCDSRLSPRPHPRPRFPSPRGARWKIPSAVAGNDGTAAPDRSAKLQQPALPA